jgi:molybdate transport system regulatory protein
MALRVRSKCWVEQDGELVLSDWRIDLLQAVDELGSLSAAAERFEVAYRVAWGKIREIEARLGTQLLEGHSGGAGGGGARLTPQGRELVDRYNRFRAGLTELIERRFAEEFGA